jgi:hypothetical protein
MNERIKQLAEQAEEYAVEKAQDGFSNYNLVYDRKFAELIVRECADIAFAKITKDSEAVVVSNAILDSFGVER